MTAINCWKCGRVYNSDVLKKCPLCGAPLKEPEKEWGFVNAADLLIRGFGELQRGIVRKEMNAAEFAI